MYMNVDEDRERAEVQDIIVNREGLQEPRGKDTSQRYKEVESCI